MEDKTTYLYKQHVYNKDGFPTNYTELEYVYGGYKHTLRYSKDGKEGVSLQQAQAMLKVLGIELYEVMEINTFKEFSDFLFENDLIYRGEKYERCIGDRWENNDGSVSEIEDKYNVKLNILRD
jgi:hypothetical protein